MTDETNARPPLRLAPPLDTVDVGVAGGAPPEDEETALWWMAGELRATCAALAQATASLAAVSRHFDDVLSGQTAPTLGA